jgi:hypothetical protein
MINIFQMKEKILVALFLFSGCMHVFAQKADSANKHLLPAKFFMGVATGTNQQSGPLGLTLELPVTSLVSIGTGIGRSTWGTKSYGEARYYFSPHYIGWAVGAGITHNTGESRLKMMLTTTSGSNEKVEINARPVTNAFFSGYRFGKLGRHRNRFYVQAGYSVPFGRAKYSVASGQKITRDSERLVSLLSPGGFIAALGFSFAL